MLKRNLSLVVCLALAASMAAFGQANQGTGYLFELPGAAIAGSRLQGWIANGNLNNPVLDAVGPVSSTQVIAVPNGSKFYVLGSGAGGLQSVDPAFTAFRSINGVTGNPCVAAISPNGKYLLVATAAVCGPNSPNAASFFILDTTTDSLVQNTVPISGNIVSIVVSRDSKTAWLLANSAFTTAVTAVSLTSQARIGQPLNLPFGGATSLTMSPLGLLYATEVNRVYEIDPSTMQITPSGEIAIVATPGPLRYTPDGTTAYLVNQSPSTGGQSILKIGLSSHSVTSWPVFNSGITPPVFDDIYVASDTLIFAHTPLDSTIWDVTPSPLSAAQSTVLAGVVPVTGILAAALSNEVPSVRFLYLLVANGAQTDLVRADLSTTPKSVSGQTLSTLGPGILQFVIVPPESGAAAFKTYNQLQTLNGGGTTAPLLARVLDSTGRPIFNLPVTYSVDSSTGIVISGAAQTTNADGYVQATATVPNTPGTYTITLTAGGVSTTFTITVPGAGGGGPNGGPSQVTIVGGNGMFIQAFNGSPLYSPLTIKVVDTNGKPLVNTPVTFTIVSGPGGTIDNANTATDTNGIASTDFFAQPPQQGFQFQATDINASTTVGSVDFIETTFILNQDGTGQPQIQLLKPLDTLVVGEGDVVTDAIVVSVSTSLSPTTPVPGIGIRIGDGNDYTQPGPASCQGDPLSDNLGMIHCNLVASCQAGGTGVRTGINVDVGAQKHFPLILVVGPGTSRTLSILNGNNQTGRVGDLLPLALVATATDNCGAPIAGVNVTWAVTKGSATLSNAVNVSDAAGHVSTRVTLGQIPGAVQVTVSIGTTAQVVFNLTNNVVISGVSVVSGNNQTAFTNQAFSQPLTFLVKDTNNNPVPNIQLTFSVAGGTASINPTQATTNAQGQASTNATAGSGAGPVTITATYGAFTVSATLTVKAPGPSLTASSFSNTAGGQTGLVPCGLGTAVAPGLAPTVQGIILGNPLGFGPLPYTLQNLSMTVNGVPAPLQAIANINGVQQVNFQTPCETVPGPATIVVTVNGASTTVQGVLVAAAQPGIFTYAGPNNKLYGAVIRKLDGTYVTPSSLAHRGENYYLVVTGLGQTTPAITTNSAGNGTQTVPINQLVVGVDNAGVPVVSAEYLPGAIGVYIVEFTIPANAPTGTDQPLAIGFILNGQIVYGNPVLIPGVN